jgi:ribosomal protein S18 acetylase RimI-like enzyme
MDEAAAAGVAFELEVEKDNPRARALYERLGMRLVGESETDHHLRAT